MKDSIRNMAFNDGGIPGDLPDSGLPFAGRDAEFFNSFGKYMRGLSDLEEVRNDPDLSVVRENVNKMVAQYNLKKAKNSEYEDFIRNSIESDDTEKKVEKEVNEIKFEIHRSNVDDLTAEWVKEWHENRKKSIRHETKAKDNRDYINTSLETDTEIEKVNEPVILPYERTGKGLKRTLLVRYISLAAAAVFGLFFLVRTLAPSSDPVKLYNKYYTPYEIVPTVTRGNSTAVNDIFPQSVEKYRSGDYKSASASFTAMLSEDPASVAPRFLLGLSYMAMNDFDNAVTELDKIAGNSNTYQKEANWYLALTYLKKGEIEKAAKCFGILAQSPGFYNEPSKEILRRLR
jgi:hypothetical protein